MGAVNSLTTLWIRGDDLDVHEVTRLLGRDPTYSVFKGEYLIKHQARVARTGAWSLEAEDRTPDNVTGQINEILSGLTQDLDVWRAISSQLNGRIVLGFFMEQSNEGFDLSADTLKLLTDRGLALEFDLYGHSESREGPTDPS